MLNFYSNRILIMRIGVEEVHTISGCTDICVLYTAVDTYNKGFKIIIYENGITSFSQVGHSWTLSHFENT